jgi:ribosomal protein L37E
MFHSSDMTNTIDTLGKAGRHNMLVVAECRRCGRQAKFLAQDLATFYGQAREPRSLRFRCETCDNGDCRIFVTESNFERSHEITVWRPVKIRQG